MVIQKILFPKTGRCTEQELYFRQTAKADHKNENAPKFLPLQGGKPVKFDTYFNGFSIDKWKKYTVLDNLAICLTLRGKVKVTLVSKELVQEEVRESVLSQTIVVSEQWQEFKFPYEISNTHGMLAFELEALDEGCGLYGGEYCSEVLPEKLHKIRIGIAICTYRREKFVEETLRTLREEILENPQSLLYGHLEVFLADNGRTLEKDKIQTQNIHIYPNRNLGGTGGFTRALIEMKYDHAKNIGEAFTHAILMDDDIVIEPEAIVKTYVMLVLLKEEYKNAFIGGSMLRLDKQSIQRESGALWNGGKPASLKGGIDLRDCKSCLWNEIEEHAQFQAWWYCCLPLHMVTAQDLPLPFFIKEDDTEYGLRKMDGLILMNGICVWHEPMENKYSTYLQYYIIRNLLITNALHCQEYGAKQLNKLTILFCMNEISFFRYKNVDLFLRGIEDFLRGPKWLMEQDGEKLHQEIMAMAYQWQETQELTMKFDLQAYEISKAGYGRERSMKEKALSLGGLLFPAKGEEVVPAFPEQSPLHSCRSKRVMNYREADGKAFVVERSFRMTVRYVWKVFRILLVNVFCLKKAQHAYQKDGMRLGSLKFWKKYLGIG